MPVSPLFPISVTLSVIFCEATVIYGVIMSIILAKKVKKMEQEAYMFDENLDFPSVDTGYFWYYHWNH